MAMQEGVDNEALDELREMAETFPLSVLTDALGVIVVETGMEEESAALVTQGAKLRTIAKRVDGLEDDLGLCESAEAAEGDDDGAEEEDDEDEEDEDDDEADED